MKSTFFFHLLLLFNYLNAQVNVGFGQEKAMANVLEGNVFPFYMPEKFNFPSKGFYNAGYTTQNPLSKIYTRYLQIGEQSINPYMEGIPTDYAIESNKFCILYEGNICIDKSDQFIFQINSDDGSALWIDDKMIISNDKFSQMNKAHQDTIYLDKGAHKVKIWYFQAIDPMMGLEVKMRKIDEKQFYSADFYCIPFVDEEKIVMENNIMFDSGKSVLKKEALIELKKLSTKIIMEKFKTIIIDGYTDNTGSEAFNKSLSLERARAIKNAFINEHIEANIEINGYGSSNPIAENKTEVGRSKNRRVEMRLIK
jgi:outer membrane protein OmpA-like peptidoglycan-associated protein